MKKDNEKQCATALKKERPERRTRQPKQHGRERSSAKGMWWRDSHG